MTITESANGPAINTTDDVWIKIPSGLTLAFDPSDTTAVIAGSDYAKISQTEGGSACAVTDCSVTVLFFASDGTTACTLNANDCKTMRIPVQTDFATNDDFTVTGLTFAEMTGSTAQSDNLELEVVAVATWGTSATDEDSVAITGIVGSSSSDHDAPDAPSSVSLTVSDEGYVVISWSDPSASDVSSIQILRGVNGSTISATPVAYVDFGTETYTDTDVSLGDEVEYILRAKDTSGNLGDTETLTVTVEVTVEEEETSEEEESTEEEEVVEEEETSEEEERTEEEEVVEEEEMVEEEPMEVVFDDMSGHWAEAYVLDLYYDGIVSGNEDGDFAPDASITRAEITKMLVNSFDIDMDVEMENPFDDLSEDHWAYNYIIAAYHAGMVEGEDGMFSPDESVNRAEAVKMIVEATGAEVETPEESSFSDMLVTDWFAGYVEYLVGLEIVGGYEDGTFGIANDITRAEASKIISMMIDMM
jgi:hypothetical protein